MVVAYWIDPVFPDDDEVAARAAGDVGVPLVVPGERVDLELGRVEGLALCGVASSQDAVHRLIGPERTPTCPGNDKPAVEAGGDAGEKLAVRRVDVDLELRRFHGQPMSIDSSCLHAASIGIRAEATATGPRDHEIPGSPGGDVREDLFTSRVLVELNLLCQ